MKAKFLLLTLVGLTGIASASSNLRAELTAMNKKVTAAMMKRDVAGFTKIVKGGITPDFKYMEDGKEMSFDTMVDMMKQGMKLFTKMISAKAEIVSLSEKGNDATAITRHSTVSLMTGQDKKPHKMEFVGTSTDTYKMVKGKWLMSSMSMKTDKMLLDGKPMDMSMMPGGGK